MKIWILFNSFLSFFFFSVTHNSIAILCMWIVSGSNDCSANGSSLLVWSYISYNWRAPALKLSLKCNAGFFKHFLASHTIIVHIPGVPPHPDYWTCVLQAAISLQGTIVYMWFMMMHDDQPGLWFKFHGPCDDTWIRVMMYQSVPWSMMTHFVMWRNSNRLVSTLINDVI